MLSSSGCTQKHTLVVAKPSLSREVYTSHPQSSMHPPSHQQPPSATPLPTQCTHIYPTTPTHHSSAYFCSCSTGACSSPHKCCTSYLFLLLSEPQTEDAPSPLIKHSSFSFLYIRIINQKLMICILATLALSRQPDGQSSFLLLM